MFSLLGFFGFFENFPVARRLELCPVYYGNRLTPILHGTLTQIENINSLILSLASPKAREVTTHRIFPPQKKTFKLQPETTVMEAETTPCKFTLRQYLERAPGEPRCSRLFRIFSVTNGFIKTKYYNFRATIATVRIANAPPKK
ncbi:hypothetical protein SFRURICE_002768, partial [Spodoptera frugiperda]